MSMSKRIAHFTALAIILLAIGALTFGGCSQTALSVRPNATVPVWSDRYGVSIRYVPPDVCLSGLIRSDTTDGARVDTLIGPLCIDAHTFFRSFFGSDTVRTDTTTGITGR